MEMGYKRQPGENLNPAAFPPLYPLLARSIAFLGIRRELSLLLVANTAFLGFLIVLYIYCRDLGWSRSAANLSVVAVSISPFSYFFHMAYSESLFCVLATTYFLGRNRDWSMLCLATIVAGCIATLIIGIVLIPYLIYDVYRRTRGIMGILVCAAAVIVACSTLFGFISHLDDVQGDPMGVFNAQSGWTLRPLLSGFHGFWQLISLRPIIDAYTPDCPCYWRTKSPAELPAFNMLFVNPFVLAIVLGAGVLGYRRRVLPLDLCCFTVLV